MTSSQSPSIHRSMLTELLGYQLRRAQSSVFDDFMKSMKDSQITPGQFGVLILIDENSGLNQSTLAKALGIERSTMVGVIDGLEKRDLVERQKSPIDKRAHALTLTTKGRSLLATVKPNVEKHEQRIVGDLSDAEVKTLMSLLKRLAV
jgi:DNA-binding MarR family transcriptional regulator